MPILKSSPSITAARLKHAGLRDRPYEIRDGSGLIARVEPTGRRVFRYQIRSLRRVLTIGPWSECETPGYVTLAEARVWLERIRGAHHAGRLAEIEAELVAAMRPPKVSPDLVATVRAITFAEIAKEYVAHVRRLGWKSADEVERALTKDVFGSLGERPVQAIDAREVRTVVKAVARRAPTQAGRVFEYISSVLRHAVGNAEITTNVADALDPAALGCVERVCQRHLSDEEIVAFWHGLDRSGVSPTVKAGLRLLLLTGLRSGELLGATLDELDLAAKTLMIPPERQKMKPKARPNARPFLVPLSLQALAQIDKLRVIGEGSRFLLASPLSPDAPISEKALIAGMRVLYAPKRKKSGKAREAIITHTGERPTPHDLRKTVRTGVGRLKFPFHVCELVLNHSLGAMAKTYDQGDYLPERRAALEQWGAHVEALVKSTSNVVPLAAGSS